MEKELEVLKHLFRTSQLQMTIMLCSVCECKIKTCLLFPSYATALNNVPLYFLYNQVPSNWITSLQNEKPPEETREYFTSTNTSSIMCICWKCLQNYNRFKNIFLKCYKIFWKLIVRFFPITIYVFNCLNSCNPYFSVW